MYMHTYTYTICISMRFLCALPNVIMESHLFIVCINHENKSNLETHLLPSGFSCNDKSRCPP